MQPGPASSAPSGAGSTVSGSTSATPVGPRDLDQRQVGPVRALAVELGVERVARLVGEGPDELGELAASRRSRGVPRRSLPRARVHASVSLAGHGGCRRTVGAGCSNERSTAAWSSARWRTITSVQPGRAEARERVGDRVPGRRSRPPTGRSRGSRARAIGSGDARRRRRRRRRRGRRGEPRCGRRDRPWRAHASR